MKGGVAEGKMVVSMSLIMRRQLRQTNRQRVEGLKIQVKGNVCTDMELCKTAKKELCSMCRESDHRELDNSVRLKFSLMIQLLRCRVLHRHPPANQYFEPRYFDTPDKSRTTAVYIC